MMNQFQFHDSKLSRRQLLQQLSMASLATMAMGAPQLLAEAPALPIEQPMPTADACILVWLAGGMAAPDTLPLLDHAMLAQWRACTVAARQRLLEQNSLIDQLQMFIAEKS